MTIAHYIWNQNDYVMNGKLIFHSILRDPSSIKKIFGEVDGDRRFDISQDTLRIKVFLPVVDCIIIKLKKQFNGMKCVSNRFKFLSSKSILNYEQSCLIKSTYNFIQFYKDDVLYFRFHTANCMPKSKHFISKSKNYCYSYLYN